MLCTNDKNMIEICKDALSLAVPGATLKMGEISTGSTDMGDLSCIMPVIHPSVPGSVGKSHGNDYYIADPETACVTNAKWQLAMLKLLLSDNAKRAKKIIEEFKPQFKNKEEFLKFQDSLNSSGDRIVYRDDGIAEVKVEKEATPENTNII